MRCNMNNPMKPQARKILDIFPQAEHEWTFRVQNDTPVKHGQFMQLSLPRVGEAPISVSGFGDGYADFTIRKVGKVTDGIFDLQKGDFIFMRGCYGNGWPVERLEGKNVVIVAGGTGVSPVKSLVNMLHRCPDYAKEVWLIIGFRDAQSILFREELSDWKQSAHFHVVYTLDNEDGEASSEGWQKSLVTEFLKDIPFAAFGGNFECIVAGPPAMIKSVGLGLLGNGVPEEKIWMSLERKMSCAIGKCGHCRIDATYVCLDGPVFNYTIGQKLVD